MSINVFYALSFGFKRCFYGFEMSYVHQGCIFFIPKYSKNINIVIFFNKYCDILLLRFTSCL